MHKTSYINAFIKKLRPLKLLGLPENIKNQKFLILISIIIPCCVIFNYFYFISNYSFNFPFFDDYDAILGFLKEYILHPELNERLKLLFSQHNEHRIVFDKLIILLQYYLLDQLNFKLFIFFGNLSLILTLFFLYKSFVFKHRFHYIYLLPISIFFFNFRYYEISFWAMASIQNMWVISFVLLSLYFLFQKKSYSIYLSMFFAMTGTYTSANGLAVFFAGAFVLILNKDFFKNIKTILWFVFGIIMMICYFYDYEKPIGHPEIIEPLISAPLGFIGYIFAFLGSAFTEYEVLAICIGVALSLFIIYITIKKYYKENPIIYSLIIFLLITSVLTALTRFGFGINQALSSRYSICSVLLVVCCYLAFVSMVSRKLSILFLTIICLLALLYNLTIHYKYIPDRVAQKKEFDINYAISDNFKKANFDFCWGDSTINYDFKILLKDSDSLGYFKFNYCYDSVIINHINEIKNRKTYFSIDINERFSGSNTVFVSGWAFIKQNSSNNTYCNVCIKNQEDNLIKYLKCEKFLRKDITEVFKSDSTDYDMSGFNASLDITALKPEKYTIFIVLINKTTKQKFEINTTELIPFK